MTKGKNCFTLRLRLFLIWQIIRAGNPRWYKGDGKRYGKVRYFHLTDMIIRVSEDRI
jgi:hypothetical protein